jgi:hypothetical protein
MQRFLLMLRNEVQRFRTAIPIHLVVVLQPAAMYLVMAAILVHPTFDMYVSRSEAEIGNALVAAMHEVGAWQAGYEPIGPPYINPIIIDPPKAESLPQIVTVEGRNGIPRAVQRFGLIDSNLVKNYRNRLTAAALVLWNRDLAEQAVIIEQHPWLPRDMPYTLYFGLAMLPMTAFLAASVIGGVLTAQEFEQQTIDEYRLSPARPSLIVAARLTRLVLTSLVAVTVLLVGVGVLNSAWPKSLWQVAMILIPVALIAGCVGIVAGLLIQRTIPAFLIGLVSSFVGWLLGGGFGLAAGFGSAYETTSRLVPNSHAVELLFPQYYGTRIGSPLVSTLALVLVSASALLLTGVVYRWRVQQQA